MFLRRTSRKRRAGSARPIARWEYMRAESSIIRKGVENCLAMVNLFLATGNFGREGAGCMMITGQGNGQGGREHGQKCDQLPGHALDHGPRGAALHRGSVGHRRSELPGSRATPPSRSWRRFTAGEIKALFSMCFNPVVSLPDAKFTREALSKLEFFGVIDFFLSETAHHADVVFAGSLQEEDEGIVCSARKAAFRRSIRPSIRPAMRSPTR